MFDTIKLHHIDRTICDSTAKYYDGLKIDDFFLTDFRSNLDSLYPDMLKSIAIEKKGDKRELVIEVNMPLEGGGYHHSVSRKVNVDLV